MSKLIFTGILETIGTRQDGTIKLILGCSEMGTTDAGRLFELRGKYLKCLITDENISPMEDKLLTETSLQDGKKVKTQSQRMRAVLYRLWEQEGGEQDFDSFYKTRTDLVIEQIKARLE